MAANKDFDLLIVPNADHQMRAYWPYWVRRRWDYFVRDLLGHEPPDYQVADIPLAVETIAESIGVRA